MINYIIRFVTLHSTATPNGLRVSVDAITKDHIAKGFGKIGYHALIQPDGELIQTLPLNVKGAHVKDHNTNNIGIALAGTSKYTEAQFRKLREYIRTLELCSAWKIWDLVGHYEWDTGKLQGKTDPQMRTSDIVCWYLLNKEDPIEKYLL